MTVRVPPLVARYRGGTVCGVRIVLEDGVAAL